jgi:3-deoxy-D-manno-octulosonic-acid transferase
LIFIYKILSCIIAAIVAPALAVGGMLGNRRNFDRLGFYTKHKSPHTDSAIWIHSSSVGEFNLAKLLLNSLSSHLPGARLISSVFTSRGMYVAEKQLSEDIELRYLPVDCVLAIERALNRANPALFISIETELWPNLMLKLHERDIPVAIVNGRLSQRNFARYRSARSLFSPLLSKTALVHTQTAEDAARFRQLGVQETRLLSGTNIKTAGMIENLKGFKRDIVLDELGISRETRILIFGSTRPGEEEIILEAFQNVRKEFPDVKAIVAPRHTVRTDEIEQLIREAGLVSARRSALPESTGTFDIIILDTLGELWKVYGIGACAFVGGSLVPIGGHNPLEPIALGVPTCFGPHMENCIDMARACLSRNLAVEVSDCISLTGFITDCLTGRIPFPDSEFMKTEIEREFDQIVSSLCELWRRSIASR